MTTKEHYRILLVEDDQKLGQKIRRFLEQHQFEVDWHTGASLLGVDTGINAFDLILCDINLPDSCGLDICRTWREKFHGSFVFITAFADDETQLKGFELGADDYIIKPVQPALLLARIQANIRKNKPNKTTVNNNLPANINLPQLLLNERQHSIKINNIELAFTQQEFQLFYLLAKNYNDKVTREAMFKIALGKDYDGFDRTVDVYVSKLRKKFNGITGNPYQIKTLWGKGYILTKN